MFPKMLDESIPVLELRLVLCTICFESLPSFLALAPRVFGGGQGQCLASSVRCSSQTGNR